MNNTVDSNNTNFTLNLEEIMISPLFCRQNFNPEYFRKEHNFIIENHKKEEFIDFFYSNSHNFGSEKQNQNAVIEILYSSLFHAIRSGQADLAIEDFIQKYSNAIIVNLGSGLDTTFNRINNDKNKKLDLYNLDLPESIEFRKKYFGQENGIKSIKKSVFDKSWFDDINYKEGDNIFFLALGLFDYFKADKVRNLLNDMAKKFPNGELFLNSSYEKSKIVTNNGYCPKNLRFNFENLYGFLKENENIGLKNRENFINIIIKFRKLFRERISDIIEKVNKSGNLDENMIIYELSNVLYNNPMELILLNFNKRISNIL